MCRGKGSPVLKSIALKGANDVDTALQKLLIDLVFFLLVRGFFFFVSYVCLFHIKTMLDVSRVQF